MNAVTRSVSAALAIASAVLSSCSYERSDSKEHTKTTTMTTAAYYDPARSQLTIECKAASGGACLFLVDSGKKQQALTLNVGTTSTVHDIEPTAKMCTSASAAALTSCNWVPVHQATGS